MSKLSYNDKVGIYNKRKEGYNLSALQSQYRVTKHNIQYLIRLIDKHGFEILRTSKNKNVINSYK